MAIHEHAGVPGDGLADLGVAVAQCGHINPRREVDVIVAVHVAQDASLARFKRHRKQLDLARKPLEILRAAIVILL